MYALAWAFLSCLVKFFELHLGCLEVNLKVS